MIMSSSTLIPTHLRFRPPNPTETANSGFSKTRRMRSYFFPHLWVPSSSSSFGPNFNLEFSGDSSLIARVSGDDEAAVDAYYSASLQQQSEPSDIEETFLSSSSKIGEGYVALFVRMLGLDHDPLDREQAVVALWKFSLRGKKFVDEIMQFPGCINLTVNLLKAKSASTCEAAAGLLRSMSSVNLYRDYVADAGAIEEINGLLTRASLAPEVKEQSLCTLWNLAVDEKYRLKIADSDVLPIIINCLNDENMKVKEAAGGVLSTLSLSPQNHDIMVELGVIPKMAAFLRANEKGAKVLRKESRNALLELAKNDYYRILVIEEGLVPVPVVSVSAYKSFRSSLCSWPSLPDSTGTEQAAKVGSQSSGSELLLGLTVADNNLDLEAVKMKATIGRTQQQFLARISDIELDDEKKSLSEFPSQSRLTLLPSVDGVARLVLILGLEDESAISRAAESIAASAINEYMREFFKEAGAVKLLVQLLDRNNASTKSAATCALEKLSLSNDICQIMEAEGVIYHLVNNLKQKELPKNLMEKTLNLLARVLDPTRKMKSKLQDQDVPINGSEKSLEKTKNVPSSIGLTNDLADDVISKYRKDVDDPLFIDRLVEIMKTSSPTLQRKAVYVVECVTDIDPSNHSILSSDIESGLEAVFKQKVISEVESRDAEEGGEEADVVEIEEAGFAISAASRLLTKLLESSSELCKRVDSGRLTALLRQTLKSSVVPMRCKDSVAAALIKLSSVRGGFFGFMEDPTIKMEVRVYETIPRLIQQLKDPYSSKESAVLELNKIISERGVVESVAKEGGIFPLVRFLEEGSARDTEGAALDILYKLSLHDSENDGAIVAAGAVPVLRRIIVAQRPHWTQALRLLRNLPT